MSMEFFIHFFNLSSFFILLCSHYYFRISKRILCIWFNYKVLCESRKQLISKFYFTEVTHSIKRRHMLSNIFILKKKCSKVNKKYITVMLRVSTNPKTYPLAYNLLVLRDEPHITNIMSVPGKLLFAATLRAQIYMKHIANIVAPYDVLYLIIARQ